MYKRYDGYSNINMDYCKMENAAIAVYQALETYDGEKMSNSEKKSFVDILEMVLEFCRDECIIEEDYEEELEQFAECFGIEE